MTNEESKAKAKAICELLRERGISETMRNMKEYGTRIFDAVIKKAVR